jgi:hypothetical protein
VTWLDWIDEQEAALQAIADPWDRYSFSCAAWSTLMSGLAAQIDADAPSMPDWEPIDEAHGEKRWLRVARRWEAKHQ